MLCVILLVENLATVGKKGIEEEKSHKQHVHFHPSAEGGAHSEAVSRGLGLRRGSRARRERPSAGQQFFPSHSAHKPLINLDSRKEIEMF
jgi:hypothetical protein